MSQVLPDIEKLVPHRGTMLLIDRLVEATDDRALGEVCITETSCFYRDGQGVPAYVGIEYMAQTVAAYDGAKRLRTGAAPEIGFLLGTRRYAADRDYFRAGDRLSIKAEMVFNDGGMASFDCTISVNGVPSVTATLNVFRPEAGEAMPRETSS